MTIASSNRIRLAPAAQHQPATLRFLEGTHLPPTAIKGTSRTILPPSRLVRCAPDNRHLEWGQELHPVQRYGQVPDKCPEGAYFLRIPFNAKLTTAR